MLYASKQHNILAYICILHLMDDFVKGRLIDQADIFVTGDTGVMHLASATKRLRQARTIACTPKNSVKIIAIFGGTNPDIWGDSERTTIVGRGRREQRCFSPGFVKEMYNPKGKDLFDHISSKELADSILCLL